MSVVVAYSASPTGEAAIEAAIEEAKRRNVGLRIVHVAKVGARQETFSSMQSHGVALEHHAERARVAGVEGVSADEVRSAKDISDTLLAYLAEHEATILVIGIRRRSPVGKAVLGSVSQDMMLRADCPVLGVKDAEH